MTISNLGTLRTACNSWTERTLDSSLFVEFAAEATNFLHYGMRDPSDRAWVVPPLRTRLMLTDAQIAVTNAVGALPASWLEFERLWINTSTGLDLAYVPEQSWRSLLFVNETGEPTTYTIDSDGLRFAPTSDATVEASYYQTLGALSADGDTNVVLTAHPHIYRHGCLWKVFDWEGNLERSDRELMAFANSVKALNAERRQSQTQGSLLRMRPRSVV